MYDYLVVGGGLFGCVIANKLKNAGYKVLIVEQRNTLGGNCIEENINGMFCHKYGPHIFHTSYEDVWQYVNEFETFNNFHFTPIANYKGKLYSLPFNLKTFYDIYGEYNPEKCKKLIKNDIIEPKNLEEQAIKFVGEKIYNILIKGYTEKQWSISCKELPPDIIKRLPIRYTFNDSYFNDKYVGIPETSYNKFFENLIKDIDIILRCKNWREHKSKAKYIIYTGKLDEYFDYQYGKLDYRRVYFETEELINTNNYQGCAVMNFTDKDVPYTRIIEHRWFRPFNDYLYTIITKEYPTIENKGIEAYPLNNNTNNELYNKYKELIDKEENVIIGGRLAEYKYYDMDDTIKSAFNTFEKIIKDKV